VSYLQPLGPDDLDRDDEALDVLGRGELPAGANQVEVMLAAWRADIADTPVPPARLVQARPLGPDDLDRDEVSLEVLGRGDIPAGGDQVEVMLAAWRADFAGTQLPAPRPTPTAMGTAPVAVTAILDVRSAAPSASADQPTPASREGPDGREGSSMPVPTRPDGRRPASGPGRSGRDRRRSRGWRLTIAAVSVAILAGGVATAAANATPNSPLWPVARLLYPQRADRLSAQDALAQARTAIHEGRIADAQQLLARAQTLVAQVDDPVERSRLRGELDQVRQLLPGAVGVISPGNGSASHPPPSSGPGPSATTGSPPPSQLTNPGLPSLLPTGILPTHILPTSLVPSLPILGG
jgi:hypothetical protein